MDHTEFSLALSDAARQRRAAELLVREAAATFQAAERQRIENRGHRFSIVRAISCMAKDGLRDGLEREIGEEMAHRAGASYDINRVMVPWGALLNRQMVVGTAAKGGNLADALDVTIGEALRGYSAAFDAGISTLSGLKYDVQIAQEAAGGTGYWLGEVGTATASLPTFAAASLTPKHAGGYVEVSRQLLLQSPGVDAFIGRSLRRTIGQLLDAAIISGDGTDAPQGLNGMTGIVVTTATAMSYGEVLSEEEQIINAYVSQDAHKYIVAPDVKTTLSQRTLGTDAVNRFVWENGRILGKPAFATPAAGTAVMVHGDFSQAVLGLFGPSAFVMEINPYANFKAAIVGVRVLLSCDLAVSNVGALRVVTDIS